MARVCSFFSDGDRSIKKNGQKEEFKIQLKKSMVESKEAKPFLKFLTKLILRF